MFVLKNKKDGTYFGIINFGSFKDSYKWIKDLESDMVKTFETRENAEEYVHNTLVEPFYTEDKPIITEIKVVTTVKRYEAVNPEVFQACETLKDYILNIRGHKDAITALLNDMSLNHDTNVCVGYISRKIEAAGLDFSNKETYEYSDIVGNMTYKNKDGIWRPASENRDELLSFKARRVAEAFATMADCFALIEKYSDKANENKVKTLKVK
jgi:hypothetical protein